ncbi:small heat shock protein hspD [Elysia marginata]|uniref:Small heat shock protein hspD n=1 Tax=Elysia marginata TaxID=1093978 RepID=A0AAV4FSA1_9GAST|nr:small heat shock protein hspD [Elysia marginata]
MVDGVTERVMEDPGEDFIELEDSAGSDQDSEVEVFLNTAATVEDVVSAGEKAIVCLYGGNSDYTPNSLRHAKFCEKASKSLTSVKVDKLPPTSAASRYHGMCAYLSPQLWLESSLGLI